MSIITLTTDWHNDDFYTGAIKGLLYSKCPQVNVIDITHKIESFKYTQAAFVLRNAFTFYPEGTIHIIGINSDTTDDHPPICLKIHGQFFLGTASGIFSLIFTEKPDIVVKIEENELIKKSSFPELTIFAEAASFLINGGTIEQLGPELPRQYRHVQLMPAFDENDITGSVIYIDSYQNIITNITKELFNKVRNKRDFIITAKSATYSINKLSSNYSEVDPGEILALFNSLGLLEIAQRNGNFAELTDININSPVTIKFK